MSWSSHAELAALNEAKQLRARQQQRDAARRQRKADELSRRERLKAEIAQIRWRAVS